MEIIAVFLGVGIVVLAIWGLLKFIGAMLAPWRGTPKSGVSQRPGTAPGTSLNTDMTAEEEGNVHSGPYGYSPNTAYPETQYGSLFNPDAEWNHEEQ